MSIILKLLKKFLSGPVQSGPIASLVRHAIGALSGALLALGLSEEVVAPFSQAAEQTILALLGLLLSYALSRINKKED